MALKSSANYPDIIFPNVLIPQDTMFGFGSVEVFNPSAFWELHWTILSGRQEGKIFHCPAPSHLGGFPRTPGGRTIGFQIIMHVVGF